MTDVGVVCHQISKPMRKRDYVTGALEHLGSHCPRGALTIRALPSSVHSLGGARWTYPPLAVEAYQMIRTTRFALEAMEAVDRFILRLLR